MGAANYGFSMAAASMVVSGNKFKSPAAIGRECAYCGKAHGLPGINLCDPCGEHFRTKAATIHEGEENFRKAPERCGLCDAPEPGPCPLCVGCSRKIKTIVPESRSAIRFAITGTRYPFPCWSVDSYHRGAVVWIAEQSLRRPRGRLRLLRSFMRRIFFSSPKPTVVADRLHTADPSADVVETGGDGWKFIRLPTTPKDGGAL
jgi:hypothetical protein